jgi:hypothetical protein
MMHSEEFELALLLHKYGAILEANQSWNSSSCIQKEHRSVQLAQCSFKFRRRHSVPPLVGTGLIMHLLAKPYRDPFIKGDNSADRGIRTKLRPLGTPCEFW